MRKAEGLRFLQSHFGDRCVDTTICDDFSQVRAMDLEPKPGRVWRVRVGTTRGSELNTPYGSFTEAEELYAFARRVFRDLPAAQVVVHRVGSWYFQPDYIGTIAVYHHSEPHMFVEFQGIPAELVGKLMRGQGARPRDWSVVARFTYPYMRARATPTGDAAGRIGSAYAKGLRALWEIGRAMDDLRPGVETLTRFNLYGSSQVVLDDHRSVSAFSWSA